MPCLPGLALTAPQLPSPLSLTPPTVSVDLGLPNLCCRLPPIPIPIPVMVPIPPIILNPAVIAILNAFIDQAISYINLQPLECPLE